ncbi:hypothetical protein RIF29_00067 [Crotalaria pallida]|uniref:Secreted protein n=1 Tax=Crotalaria pallida TaxID=3830 RepID=A0AAN9IVG0_CROPI
MHFGILFLMHFGFLVLILNRQKCTLIFWFCRASNCCDCRAYLSIILTSTGLSSTKMGSFCSWPTSVFISGLVKFPQGNIIYSRLCHFDFSFYVGHFFLLS